ncbi:hypothetical protein FDR95_28805 [Rhizobiaceae bacterium LC148]|nr:hypothetical protein FDR95_28805 [Rhizobiaceae bacterium LC148]
MWSPAGYDTQTNPTQVALDRRTRDMPIDFGTVPSKRQANQLASIYYNENRYEATADIVLRPYFQDIQVGDWVEWNSERYGSRVYIVQSRSIRALTSDGPRNVALSLQERSGDIYAGAGVLPPVIPIASGEPVYLNELPDWTPIPVLAMSDDGRTIAAFRMSWSPFDDVSVTGIQFRWWPTAQPDNVFTKNVQADITMTLLQEGVVSETNYSFQHRLIAPGRPTVWSSIKTATSLASGNEDIEVYLANLNKEVLDRFAEIQADNRQALNMIMETLTNFSLDGAVGEVQRSKMRAEVGRAFAQIIEERRVRVTADEALAEIITLLDTEFDDSMAAVGQRITALSSETEALAETVDTLNAAVGDVSAQGLVKFTLSANQSGVDARYSVAIRGTVAQAYKETGFFLELYTVNGVQRTRFAILADQFVVTDGNQYTLPMVYENGVLKLSGVQISWADISSAVINNAVFGTTNLDYNAVSARGDFSGSGSLALTDPNNVWHTIGTLGIDNPNPSAVMLHIVGSYSGSLGPNASGTFSMRVVNETTGEVSYSFAFSFSTGGSSAQQGRDINNMAISVFDVRGGNTYRVQIMKSTGNIPGANFQVKMLWWKR